MNRLRTETSPYLLQHVDNPVDWYPWGDEALAAAREANKPILLSIGYSACHWCHVMAHESFEDKATAEVMNRLYINIKVDREERPDIDKIYQTAHQLITRRGGGWPLTVFLTPDGQLPFFAGTYFPKEPRHGMPAFTDLLVQVAHHFEMHQDDVARQGEAIVHALDSLEAGVADAATSLTRAPVEGLREQLGSNFDPDWGGFGDAPKFPHPTSLDYLLRHWRASAHSEEPDVQALFMCALTLTRMVEGGIYDHIGGGFFRYSVDRMWAIPHFEKMLYDNGPLLALLAHLWQASGDDTFRQAATATADWLLRDMRSPAGGFWSALDADSEGEEGRFYVWQPEEVATLLEPGEYTAIAARYGLTQPANFEERWHLQVRDTLENTAAAVGQIDSTTTALLASGRQKLLAARELRVWPGLDKKILTAWNALTIRGLAIAGSALNRDDLIDAAAEAVEFIRSELWQNNTLLACHKDAKARFPAYLDDYAFLLDALLELMQAQWNSEHLSFAVQLADALLDQFSDEKRGGFYFTGRNHEQLIHRSRTFSDDSLPNGNGVAALALGRLGHLLGDTRYLQAAERTLQAGQTAMNDFPHGHAAMIIALGEYLEPPEIVVIRGTAGGDAEARAWATDIRAIYAPRRMVFAIAAGANELPGALQDRAPGDSTTAYLCRGSQCSLPMHSQNALLEAIRESQPG